MRIGAFSAKKPSSLLEKHVGHGLLKLFAFLLVTLCSGYSSIKKERAQILAVPWQDKHPVESHRFTFEAKTCSISVSPIHADNEPSKGIFTHFVLSGNTYLAKVSFFNGKFSTVEVYKMEAVTESLHFQAIASTKVMHSVLDIKSAVCGNTEAYLVVILTKDGLTSQPQLLVFKPDEKDVTGEKFVIAHNGQLSSAKGVADVSISCVENHVMFAFAASTALIGAAEKEVSSSVRIWSPKTRAVRKVFSVDTINAVSVVSFRNGDCQVHVFVQKNNGQLDEPLDTLIYCVRSTSGKTAWSLELIQAVTLCDVYGVELYTNSKQEVGLFAAISKKTKAFPQCPKSSLALKWTGQHFEIFRNITISAVADFFYLATPCCSFLLARHIGAERTLAIVGSTEPLFEGVLKFEHLTLSDRQFLLISFTGEMHQGALHEVACSKRSPTIQTSLSNPQIPRPRGGALSPQSYLLVPAKSERMMMQPPAPLTDSRYFPVERSGPLVQPQMLPFSLSSSIRIPPRTIYPPLEPMPLRPNFNASLKLRPFSGPLLQSFPQVQYLMQHPPQYSPPSGPVPQPAILVRYANASRLPFLVPPMHEARPSGFFPSSLSTRDSHIHSGRSNNLPARRIHHHTYPVQPFQHAVRGQFPPPRINQSFSPRSWTPNLRRLNDKLEDFA